MHVLLPSFNAQAFVEVVNQIKRDPYLSVHARYYMREVSEEGVLL